MTDLSNLVSTEFYLGKNPVSDVANNAVFEYFSAIPIDTMVRSMHASEFPANALLRDWAGAVRNCRYRGIPEDAFLPDGADLFRFAPNAISYMFHNKDDFSGINIHEVNNASSVESYLTSGELREDGTGRPHSSWLMLLTGYTPEDNGAIPLLTERYNSTRVLIALDAQNRRF